MSAVLKISVFAIFLLLAFSNNSYASLESYTYPYEISYMDWQLLSYSTLCHNTITPADPFILDRLEYDRKLRKIKVYLTGSVTDATDDNFNKALGNIVKLLTERFPKFDRAQDLIVYYDLSPANGGQEITRWTYQDGQCVKEGDKPSLFSNSY